MDLNNRKMKNHPPSPAPVIRELVSVLEARVESLGFEPDTPELVICHIKKVKSSMARSLPVENLLPQNVGSTTSSNILK